MSTWIQEEMAAITARGERRRLEHWRAPGALLSRDDVRLVNLASNDYLGLTGHPAVREAAADAARTVGPGATASRLLAGSFDLHAQLEQALAAWKGHPACLLFSSGYLAALGVITTVVSRGDLVVADRLSHACLLDGARLSGATLKRFRHNDPEDAARCLADRAGFRRCLLITESLFSMDGDLAPLAELKSLAGRHDALLLVDEAHAIGVAGPRGAGFTADDPAAGANLITLGTLGKALASAGGFVTCSADLRELFINRARSFIFDTALPPPSLAAALAALRLIEAHPEWPTALRGRAGRVAEILRLPGSATHILPVLLGEAERTMRVAGRLRDRGVLVGAIRPPTVPPNTSRLRISLNLGLDPLELDRAVGLIREELDAG